VLPVLPEKSVAHVITDPPYSEHVHAKEWQSRALAANGDKRASTEHAGIGFEPLTDVVRRAVAAECERLAQRWSLAFCDLEGIGPWRSDLLGVGLEWVRACIWDKIDSAPQFTGDRPANSAEAICVSHPPGRKRWSGGGKRNVYRHAVNAERGGKPHPTTKPVPLMTELVEDFTDPDELVLDPFAGSGTTGVACLRLGRRCILIEKSEKYAALARERMRAESQGLTLRDARAGQLPLLAGV
jgi:site-specific DNA-methyltransferase (adenine-specific)